MEVAPFPPHALSSVRCTCGCVHMEVVQDKAHLQVALGLHEGAHDTKTGEQVALWVGDHARDDGVVGPLARAQAVGVLGVQDEAVAAVLQAEAAPLRHDAWNAKLGGDLSARRGSRMKMPCLHPLRQHNKHASLNQTL